MAAGEAVNGQGLGVRERETEGESSWADGEVVSQAGEAWLVSG